jgi:hypothetical protein
MVGMFFVISYSHVDYHMKRLHCHLPMVLDTKDEIGMWVFDKPNVGMCVGPEH